MEALKLSENELRFFNELFGACDVENTGKVSGPKATELFRTSQLPHDVLHQITELCGAKRLGHFGRSQFFLACKLISAAQIGLPLKLETFTTVETPLPKFTRASEIDRWQQQQPHQQPTGKTRQNLIHLQDQESGNHMPGQLPPPPTKSRPIPGNQSSQRPPSLFDDTEPKFPQQGYGISKAGSPPPPPTLLTEAIVVNRYGGLTSPGHSDLSPPPSGATILPTALATALTSMDKDWATYVAPNHGHQALVEGHQWQQFEDDRQLLTTEDETSERHSSDDEECIYVITDEQREYYTNQFKTMQPNLSGQISGAIAKEFFEKSKLPLQELSKIWQLSDVNKDGALSLEEFCTAMHLVVLRRNNITLPDVLPAPLVPQINRLTFEVGTESGHPTVPKAVTSPRRSPTEPTSPQSKEWTRFNDSPTSSVLSSPGIKPVNFDFQKSSVEQDPKILHPVPVRLSPDSHLTSSDDGEAPKSTPPIQVDQNQYELLRDHQRSPSKKAGEAQNQVVAIQRPVVKKSSVSGPGSLPPPPTTVQANSSVNEDSTIPNPARDQRSGSFSGPMSCYPHGSLLPLGSLGPGPKKEPPPPPPPRPKRNHARSSSLDLNRLVTGRGSLSGPQSQSAQLGAPPAVPPRMSPSATTPKKLVGQKSETDAGQISEQAQANFADFTQFSQHRLPDETNSSEVPQLKTGAFEVYRRPSDPIQGGGVISGAIVTTTNTTQTAQTTAAPKVLDQGAMKSDTSNSVTVNNNSVVVGHGPTSTLIETKQKVADTGKLRDKKEMHTWLRSQKERNMALCRLNSELNQELSEVMEERIALEIQLEHLKPYSN